MVGTGGGLIIGFGYYEIIIVLLFVCFVVAYLMSIRYLVDAAAARGSTVSKARLWFIGLFMTPIVLGLLAIASKHDG